MTNNCKTLRWSTGYVTLQLRGAMIRDLEIQMRNGQKVTPLHTAPWVNTPQAAHLDGLMQGLSCEWPCVPFGMPHRNLPPDWSNESGWEDPFAHGYAAHHDWEITASNDALYAEIRMPSSHPIEKMRRRIRPCKDGIGLDLWVTPRRNCQLPIGLHPVFRLPKQPGRMLLEVAGAQHVMAHPENPSADPSPAEPGVLSCSLKTVRATTGAQLDFSQLPRDEQSETRLLVLGAIGRVTLTDQNTGIATVLRYDAEQFPFVMLWISNRGRSAAPWSGRHLALGIEPVRAAFDLGSACSASLNPLSQMGAKTTFDLKKGDVFHTSYSITVPAPSTRAV